MSKMIYAIMHSIRIPLVQALSLMVIAMYNTNETGFYVDIPQVIILTAIVFQPAAISNNFLFVACTIQDLVSGTPIGSSFLSTLVGKATFLGLLHKTHNPIAATLLVYSLLSTITKYITITCITTALRSISFAPGQMAITIITTSIAYYITVKLLLIALKPYIKINGVQHIPTRYA